MKLAFVEIAGFRGFKERTRFDLPGGFAVLTGRNGVGKSTLFDAVDFVLTGTINKYTVKGARGGGLDDHIWWVGEGVAEHQYVAVGFSDENGEEHVFERSRERGLNTPVEDIASQMCSLGESPPHTWLNTLMQTTLIRDETIAALSLDLPEQARFAAVRAAIGGLSGPGHTQRTDALMRAATAAKSQQEARVTESQAELGRALGALTEARSVAERQADVVEAEQIIAGIAPDIDSASGDYAEMLRRRIAERKRATAEVESAISVAERLQTQLQYLDSDTGRGEIETARTAQVLAGEAKRVADEILARTQQLEAVERESDAFASHMVLLLNHGELVGLQNGHCPLCEAARSPEEFAAAIEAARSRLILRGARATEIATAIEKAYATVAQAETELKTAEHRLSEIEAQRTSISNDGERVTAVFSKWDIAASPSEPEKARRLLLQRQEETARLEHALFMLEASSAHDRVSALEARIEQLRTALDQETARLAAAERAVEAARQIDNGARNVANQVLTEQFDTVLPLLKELYQRLRPHTDWREIELDFGGRVRASLNFTVGDGRNPQFLFSSGQRRAAGIAFLLAIHLSRPWCRLRSLLLDDPVQHIDDYRALNLVEVLSAVRRTGRQVIVSVEDPALADVLCRRLRSTAVEGGRRFELSTSKNGSAAIERQTDIFPLSQQIMEAVGTT